MAVIEFDDYVDSEAEVCPDCQLLTIQIEEIAETARLQLQELVDENKALKSRLAGKPIAKPNPKNENSWEYCPECLTRQVGPIKGSNPVQFYDMCDKCKDMDKEEVEAEYEEIRSDVRKGLRDKIKSRRIVKRKKEAVMLLQEGKTHPEIARLLGTSESQAYRDTKDVLAD